MELFIFGSTSRDICTYKYYKNCVGYSYLLRRPVAFNLNGGAIQAQQWDTSGPAENVEHCCFFVNLKNKIKKIKKKKLQCRQTDRQTDRQTQGQA